ncbi:MAG: segregation/condensation protein A [Syntrophaceticus schinkii]
MPAGEIPVCTIIDQFIDYYMGIAFSDLEEGSRFLVLAATLLAVKARLLLPRHEEEDEESDPLLDQDDEDGLLETDFEEYLAFQDAAITLEERAREWMMVYRRPLLKLRFLNKGCQR